MGVGTPSLLGIPLSLSWGEGLSTLEPIALPDVAVDLPNEDVLVVVVVLELLIGSK